MTRQPRRPNRSRSGNTIIEFVLVTALVLLPLLMGGMVIGFNLIRAIQANQVMSSHFARVRAGGMKQDGTVTVINPYTDHPAIVNDISQIVSSGNTGT